MMAVLTVKPSSKSNFVQETIRFLQEKLKAFEPNNFITTFATKTKRYDYE